MRLSFALLAPTLPECAVLAVVEGRLHPVVLGEGTVMPADPVTRR